MTKFNGADLQATSLTIYIILEQELSLKAGKRITEVPWQDSSEKGKRANILSFVTSIKQSGRDNNNSFCLAYRHFEHMYSQPST